MGQGECPTRAEAAACRTPAGGAGEPSAGAGGDGDWGTEPSQVTLRESEPSWGAARGGPAHGLTETASLVIAPRLSTLAAGGTAALCAGRPACSGCLGSEREPGVIRRAGMQGGGGRAPERPEASGVEGEQVGPQGLGGPFWR